MNEVLLVIALLVAPAVPARHAQTVTGARPPTGGEWYVSWGYNTAQYARTDIRFVQPGNDFTLVGAEMHDSKAWDIWNHSITVPQYSFRVGKFIRPNTAIELNFDHAKAILVQGQNVRVRGTLNGASVDQRMNVTDVVQEYQLNNGANFVLINVVQRFRIAGEPGRTGSVSVLAKAGGGFMVPHAQNTVLDQPNVRGFQYGGLGAGLEGAVRVHIFRMVYVEVAEKGYYGYYRNLNIHDGKANQNLRARLTVISFGFTFDFGAT